MAAGYCYEGIPLRFLASLFDIQMRYLVYMRYLYGASWGDTCWYGMSRSYPRGCLSIMIDKERSSTSGILHGPARGEWFNLWYLEQKILFIEPCN